jgi:hypothetical protein
MVEFRSVSNGEVQLVRGRKKTDEEIAAEIAAEAEGSAAVEPSSPLLVRIVDGCHAAGGKAILLCDQDGNRLPGQVRATLDQSIDRSEITVTFAIDGAEVSFE